jgi:hypothetical protein
MEGVGTIESPSVDKALRTSATLDARFHRLRGDDVTDKDRAFRALFDVLESTKTPYALIGGVAVQLWVSEPRTTLDIDVAVPSYDAIPVEALAAAGFRRLERYAHSENWLGPDDVPVQFTDDPLLQAAVARAVERTFAGGRVRLATPDELVRAKVRAASDPARRRSKRLRDLADAVVLVEEHPDVEAKLSAEERTLLRG